MNSFRRASDGQTSIRVISRINVVAGHGWNETQLTTGSLFDIITIE